jgi:hypothetical protein
MADSSPECNCVITRMNPEPPARSGTQIGDQRIVRFSLVARHERPLLTGADHQIALPTQRVPRNIVLANGGLECYRVFSLKPVSQSRASS